MNIGCDIVENNRLKNKPNEFIDLVLTEAEKVEYKKKKLPYLCGRFAAKEAVMKVLPNTKDIAFKDIEILSDKNGKPTVNIPNIDVSISHEKNYTIAVAIKKS